MNVDDKEKQWIIKQNHLKTKLVCENQLQDDIQYIGGVDISFVKGNLVDACAALVVLDAKTLKIVYQKCKMVQLKETYIPGFLAFREVDHLIELIEELKTKRPNLLPDVIFVDGNGILHPRGLGLASHLGVLTDIPTIGIGKNLLHVDGLHRDTVKEEFAKKCTVEGDYLELEGDSGKVWGAATKTTKKVENPIFVSIGHKVDLTKAIELTQKFSKFRVPEPVRFADILSREYLRINYKP